LPPLAALKKSIKNMPLNTVKTWVCERHNPDWGRDYILPKRKRIDAASGNGEDSGMSENPGIKLFNSAEFAKEILWRLARQQSDALDNKFLLIEILSSQTGRPQKEILEARKAACDKKAKEFYLESLRAVGFADQTDSIQDNEDQH
jgi:hypothetical protein